MATKPKSEQWTEPSFLEAIEKRGNEEELLAAVALLAWAKSKFSETEWGSGTRRGTLSLYVMRNKKRIPTFTLNTDAATAYVWIEFERLCNHEPFKELAQREEVLRQLEKAGIVIPPSQAEKTRPTIPFKKLANEKTRQAVLEVLNSIVTALG